MAGTLWFGTLRFPSNGSAGARQSPFARQSDGLCGSAIAKARGVVSGGFATVQNRAPQNLLTNATIRAYARRAEC